MREYSTRATVKILAAAIFSILGALSAAPMAAVFEQADMRAYIYVGVPLLIVIAMLLAPTARRAWARGSLIVGVLYIAMPIFIFALSLRVGPQLVDQASAGNDVAIALGAALGGGLMVGASLFVGFSLGAIFLLAGFALIIGGRSEAVVTTGRY